MASIEMALSYLERMNKLLENTGSQGKLSSGRSRRGVWGIAKCQGVVRLAGGQAVVSLWSCHSFTRI